METVSESTEPGRPPAQQLYRLILAQQSRHVGALHQLGVLARQSGRNDVAADLIRKAIAIAPHIPKAHSNLGVALKEQRNFDAAIAAYPNAIALRPQFAQAHNNLVPAFSPMCGDIA